MAVRWNKYGYGQQINTKYNWQHQQRTCKICNKPVMVGSLCKSCAAFIKMKRLQERNEGNDA